MIDVVVGVSLLKQSNASVLCYIVLCCKAVMP